MRIQISYFWPQTESAHLVDVINQTDFLEGLDREKKLGQPHGTALLLGSRVDPILLALSLMNYNFAKTHDPLLLITGAIICPDSRTVCNLLRSVGLQAERCFPKYHRLLSEDK